MNKISHSELVRKLAKPGDAILKTLTPQKVEMWHMASCIPGESGELYDAIRNGDVPNIKEELGDNYFYVEGEIQAAGINSDEIMFIGNVTVVDLPGAAGDVFDAVKKFVIYDAELNRAALVSALSKYVTVLKAICDDYGITPEDAKEQNIEKLSKRYPGIAYTDAAAQNRADKQENTTH